MGTVSTLMEGFESTSSLPSTEWYVSNPHNDGAFDITTAAASSGAKSVVLDLSNASEGYYDELFSRTYDVSSLPVVQVSFRYAFTNRDTVPQANVLKFSVSNDCGNTWSVRKQIGSVNINTAPGLPSGNFVPDALEWKSVAVTNISPSYLVNDFRIKFTYENVDGVALYLDDINISPTASIEEIGEEKLVLYPNPGDHGFSLDIAQPGKFEVRILDMSGRLVSSETRQLNVGTWSMDASGLASGGYLIQLFSFDNQTTYRGIWVKSK